MFDMSWGEILVISTVALVAIGPKDLPKALRAAGQVAGKVRRMAGEFQAQFQEAMREADLEELRKTATDINDAVAPFKSQFDPLKSAGEQLQKVMSLPELPEPPAIDTVVNAPDKQEKNESPETSGAKRTLRKRPAKKSEPAALETDSGKQMETTSSEAAGKRTVRRTTAAKLKVSVEKDTTETGSVSGESSQKKPRKQNNRPVKPGARVNE